MNFVSNGGYFCQWCRVSVQSYRLEFQLDMTRSKNRRKRDRRREELECEDVVFQTQESPVFGRYLEANRDLKPGDLILREEPAVVGPSQDSESICISCYKSIDYNTSWRCDQCGFPLCSQTCPEKNSKTGHNQDCSLMSKSQIKTIPMLVLSRSLEAIAPLRCLALKSSNPAIWEKINRMESHTQERKKIETLWTTNQRKVVDVIRNDWGLTEFDEELIHQMCGVLEVNAFEVGSGLRAIYPTAYLFAHNCTPNTKHSDGKNFEISFRATGTVRKRTPLFVTYTYILQGTLKRRKHLKDTKFFDCACERCKDPTEFGTNISTLICRMCSKGSVFSVDPLNPEANWACTSKKCPGYVISSENVVSLIDKLYAELDKINNLGDYELFLRKNAKILTENHYLLLSAKHELFQLYGKVENFLINNLTEEQLQRKVELCRNLLQAFAKLEPGFSKQRGLILYELHAPLMILMQRWFQEKKHTKQIMRKALSEVVRCLEEAKTILVTEPEGSPELEISQVAGEAIQTLSTWRMALDV